MSRGSVLGWACAALLVGCGRDSAPVVLIVSWDTTRADALGCYADVAHWGLDLPVADRPRPHTPNADALAARGIRHQWAFAHAPTTLASHATLMSGRDTRGVQVPRNGYPVAADIPLLAPAFAAAGWDTVAVVGASVLAADQGLARGFRVYDDAVRKKVRRRYERTATEVVERTLQIVDDRAWNIAQRGAPLFLFVHFFDAHSPWNSAPAEVRAPFLDLDPSYTGMLEANGASLDGLIRATREGTAVLRDRKRARALYLAEVAAEDAALGLLLDGLGERFTLDDSLVVLVGDHGESLDTPAERPYGHGLDVDLVDTHVPLLVAGTGRFATPHGLQVAAPMGLIDIAPSLRTWAGLAGDISAQGVDVSAAWAGAVPIETIVGQRWLFAEATKPVEAEQPPLWNNVGKERAVMDSRYLLTHTPWADETQGGAGPTLFALAPGQPLVPSPSPDVIQNMFDAVSGWDASAPPYRPVEMNDETKAALSALGYAD